MHVLLNDYGSGVMLLGSDLCGCLWDRVSSGLPGLTSSKEHYVPCV